MKQGGSPNSVLSGIKVRKAGSDDLSRLMEIWLGSNLEAHPYVPENYWKAHYDEVRDYYLPQSEVYCAVNADETVVGFIGLVKGYIAGLFIDREFRGRGAGGKLVSFCQKMKASLELDVFAKNTRAIHFYEKMGFSITEKKKSLDTGEEEYRMVWNQSELG